MINHVFYNLVSLILFDITPIDIYRNASIVY